MWTNAFCATCKLGLIHENRRPEDAVQGMSMLNGAIESAAAHLIVHPKHHVQLTIDGMVEWNPPLDLE